MSSRFQHSCLEYNCSIAQLAALGRKTDSMISLELIMHTPQVDGIQVKKGANEAVCSALKNLRIL
jgi:hypothetical protein